MCVTATTAPRLFVYSSSKKQQKKKERLQEAQGLVQLTNVDEERRADQGEQVCYHMTISITTHQCFRITAGGSIHCAAKLPFLYI